MELCRNQVVALSIAQLLSSFDTYLAFYDYMMQDTSFKLTDKNMCSFLLACSLASPSPTRCTSIWNSLKKCGTPTRRDYGNMVRLASMQGDWALSMKLVQDMQESRQPITRRRSADHCPTACCRPTADNATTDHPSPEHFLKMKATCIIIGISSDCKRLILLLIHPYFARRQILPSCDI